MGRIVPTVPSFARKGGLRGVSIRGRRCKGSYPNRKPGPKPVILHSLPEVAKAFQRGGLFDELAPWLDDGRTDYFHDVGRMREVGAERVPLLFPERVLEERVPKISGRTFDQSSFEAILRR